MRSKNRRIVFAIALTVLTATGAVLLARVQTTSASLDSKPATETGATPNDLSRITPSDAQDATEWFPFTGDHSN